MRLSASLFLAVTMSVVGAGCGSGGRSGAATTTTAPPATTTAATTTSGAGALQAEADATAAGDIPDNQVFLVFRDVPAGYSMKYPEGWVGAAGIGQQGLLPGQEQRHPRGCLCRRCVDAGKRAGRPARAEGGAGAEPAAGDDALRPARVQGRVSDGERPEPGNGQARHAVGRPLLRPEAGPARRARSRRPVGVDNVDAYRLISESFRWS